MDTIRLIEERHSVRSYKKDKIEAEKLDAIRAELNKVNEESGLHIQMVEVSGGALSPFMSMISGWKNKPNACLALIGKPSEKLEEKIGYYGEHMVLFLQSLGINTCWIGMFKRGAVSEYALDGEKVVAVVVAGYGENSGSARKSKTAEQVTDVKDMPEWFAKGVDCALKAPTAMNQQKFFIKLDGDTPVIEASSVGPFVKVDLGIVKYHFEAGSGRSMKP